MIKRNFFLAALIMGGVFFGRMFVHAETCSVQTELPYKSPRSSAVYFVTSDCKKQGIKNRDIYFSYFSSWNQIKTISEDALARIPNHPLGFLPWGPRRVFTNGSLIKTPENPTVYLVLNSKKYSIASEDLFWDLGLRIEWIEDVKAGVLEKLGPASAIESVAALPTQFVFKYASSPRVYAIKRTGDELRKQYISSLEDLARLYRLDRISTLPESVTFADTEPHTEPPLNEPVQNPVPPPTNPPETRPTASTTVSTPPQAEPTPPATQTTDATLTISSNTHYQTMVGPWEAPLWLAQSDTPFQIANFKKWRDEVIRQTVDEIGINRVRLQLQSEMENPTDYFSQYIAGAIDRPTWRTHWSESVNDDNDPRHINLEGFKWSRLDYDIDNVLEPMQQRLAARGEHLYVNLNYSDFRPNPRPNDPQNPNVEHWQDPEEYAEYILATFQHMQNTHGWVPDGVEVILEPDNANGWKSHPDAVWKALLAAGRRLKENGFNPEFIAPSPSGVFLYEPFLTAFHQLSSAEKTEVLTYFKELSFHYYGGVRMPNLQALLQEAKNIGVRTSMLEWWDSGDSYLQLHEDLKMGLSAREVGTLGGQALTSDLGTVLTHIDATDLNNIKVTYNTKTPFFRQYFRYIRDGAIRIGSTTSNAAFDPVAFINKNGKYVVVVKTKKGGGFSVQGLPQGTYGIEYSTATIVDNKVTGVVEANKSLPNVSVGADGTATFSIPREGVFTLYQR